MNRYGAKRLIILVGTAANVGKQAALHAYEVRQVSDRFVIRCQ
ncbi:MAG: hypothetical protein AB1861_19705 [Cyanobacteriota bacterium]